MAALLGDALRQAFMPKHEYETLRDEDKAWHRLQRPVLLSILTLITLAIVISTVISTKIVFPSNNGRRPFCRDLRIQPLSINVSLGVDSDRLAGGFYLTDQETVDYYWMVVFVPSAMSAFGIFEGTSVLGCYINYDVGNIYEISLINTQRLGKWWLAWITIL
ncbi:hypothetical protein RJ639_043962 [Escallonia herrerae]|uniref:Uncharacterized protein n=1 Tax=Escallonia herrerae TaxID=1293975 RepID=A0AA89B3G3_9ASTE|nr:hypothetical protein RJ639_043962 [Escallonia herrerae]